MFVGEPVFRPPLSGPPPLKQLHQAGLLTFFRRTQCKRKPVNSAKPLSSLDRIKAGLGSVLSLLEVESERLQACHGVHCLLAMIKTQLDLMAEELCPVA